MKKIGYLFYGAAAYAIFLFCLLLTIAFSTAVPGPKGVLRVRTAELPAGLLINLGLVTLFGLQHSVMARKPVKRLIKKIMPGPLVRSTYVLLSSLTLMLLLWQWRVIPGSLWQVEATALRGTIYIVQGLGWLLLIVATFQIDHFEFSGLRQVHRALSQRAPQAAEFKSPWLYQLVRHPMMLGLLLAIWAVPDMRIDRLIFNLGFTTYILIGLYFEEQDLVRDLGQSYQEYKQRTPKLLPIQFNIGALSDFQAEKTE